jgi:hypothetical protein
LFIAQAREASVPLEIPTRWTLPEAKNPEDWPYVRRLVVFVLEAGLPHVQSSEVVAIPNPASVSSRARGRPVSVSVLKYVGEPPPPDLATIPFRDPHA